MLSLLPDVIPNDNINVVHNLMPDSVTVTALLEEASRWKDSFEGLLMEIVSYAEKEVGDDYSKNDRQPLPRILSSIGFKDAQAIENKAKYKYQGNILRVKDVLRGCIIFPNEASLVCGLVRLHQMVKEKGDKLHNVSIARMKNMFTVPEDRLNTLPTGYQHVLVTLCFNDQFLAGKWTRLNS